MIVCEKNKCTGCGACSNICPQKCIKMEYDEEGFIYPNIDEEKCINCGMCRKICPAINEIEINNREKPTTIGAYNKNDDILANSSSGGVFSILAEYIIEQNGVVFGSVMDENLDCFHKKAENLTEYEKMRGSKYVQSKILNTYNEVKQCLTQDRNVLFVGCPCQVAGLYAFLGNKTYEKLLTVDLVCHGVAPKKIFDNFIKEQEEKYKDKIVEIYFRDKKYGYSRMTTKLVFKNRKPVFLKSVYNSYMIMYLKHGIYRESCYQCKYAKLPRIADITLGDFKGINDKMAKKAYEKGISVVLLNNKKADEVFEIIKDNMVYMERPLEEATSTNRNIIKPSIRPKQRDYILKENEKVETLQKKYFKARYREYLADALGHNIMSQIKKIKNRGKM